MLTFSPAIVDNVRIVNERKIKVNTIYQLPSSSEISSNTKKPDFYLAIDRIATAGLVDITFGLFSQPLYKYSEYKNNPPIAVDGVTNVNEYLSHNYRNIIPAKCYIFVNRELVYTYHKVYFDGIMHARIPFNDLKLSFNKLNNIVIKFQFDTPGNEQPPIKLYKEYQVVFAEPEKEFLSLKTEGYSTQIKVPYSYRFTFYSDKTYKKEVYNTNIYFRFPQINNFNYNQKLLDITYKNDYKVQKAPIEIRHTEYPPLKVQEAFLEPFIEKEKLSAELIDKHYSSNVYINNDVDMVSKTAAVYLNDYLTTNEKEISISKSSATNSQKSLKIPFKYNGEFNLGFKFVSPYFDLMLSKSYKVEGSSKNFNSKNKTLQIIEKNQNEFNYENLRFMIKLNTALDFLKKSEFDFLDYAVDLNYGLRNKEEEN
ncbi:hypothetical protein H9M94_02220 [Mycoplasma sp. Pen4]|uniref:MHO_1580 family protein n=1 Tax=Mycoplasma sp. Pen4 TaxID=640330 RepID=UPI00165466F2|nr:hypothetical protein [Mycoplasma sp. Pen4]QNM93409.1 hypothetical protein H9M94_02220 [Mycoplasma sp. Pen4]